MADHTPLSDELIELIAERFRLLGEPMRIRILDRLQDEPASVQELAQSVGSSQQNVSKHLGTLHRSGIIGRERDGNSVRYSIADPAVFELCETVCGDLRRQVDRLDAVLAPVAAGSR